MYYNACASEGCSKKVTDDGTGHYRCDGCHATHPRMVRRYMLKAKATDATGDCWVSLFNKEAQQLLGCSADELDAEKANNDAAFTARVRRAQWDLRVMRIKAASQEYQVQLLVRELGWKNNNEEPARARSRYALLASLFSPLR